jgi:glycosyltransferase involved in cell wall biosynthesis
VSGSRRVLVLAPFPPGGLPTHGGGTAIAQLVRSLARRNRVALAYLRAADESPADPSLADCCERLIESPRSGTSTSSVRPLWRLPRMVPRVAAGHPLWAASRWSPPFARLLDTLCASWKPDVVQAEFGAMGMYLRPARKTGARTVVTFHDPEPAAAAERAARTQGAERMMWRLEARLWRRFDSRLLRSVDAAIAFTARDASALATLHPTAPITIVPLGAEVAVDPIDGGSAPLLLFVGNFNHPPNVDAARYLVEELFPRVRAQHAAVEIALVGDGPPDWLKGRAADDVHVPGFVPDLQPLMRSAAVFVAPLRHGGGMRLKVVEALAAGKAVVGTSRAFEGTGVVHGRHALVIDDADGQSAVIVQLLGDRAARVALGREARAHIAATLSWDRAAAAYEAVYDRILERPSGP